MTRLDVHELSARAVAASRESGWRDKVKDGGCSGILKKGRFEKQLDFGETLSSKWIGRSYVI